MDETDDLPTGPRRQRRGRKIVLPAAPPMALPPAVAPSRQKNTATAQRDHEEAKSTRSGKGDRASSAKPIGVLAGADGLRSVQKPKKTRSRTTVPPPVPQAITAWRSSLFTADDVLEIANATSIPFAPTVELDAIALQLHQAFDHALTQDIIEERHNFAPQRKRDWYDRVERTGSALIAALDLPSVLGENWTAPLSSGADLASIWQLRRILLSDPARFSPPHDAHGRLSGLPEVKQHVSDAEKLRNANGLTWDVLDAEDARGRALAAVLIECAPRMLGLIVRLARTGRAWTPEGKKGDHPGVLAPELFAHLTAAHELMFSRGPKTRDTASTRCGPSIGWARGILYIAAERFSEAVSGGEIPNDLPSRAASLADLAELTDASIADFLEAGWREHRRHPRFASRLAEVAANPRA